MTSAGVVLDVREPLRLECAVGRVRDDAVEDLITGVIRRNGRRLDLGLQKTIPTLTGLRVPVALPQGAKIINAWVQFSADREDTGPARLVVRAEARDHASPIRTDAQALSSRPRTTASAAWNTHMWHYPGATGARQRSTDLAHVIQEVVDRPGWQSGNHMLILIEGFGQRRPRAFRPGHLDEPRLVIEYQP